MINFVDEKASNLKSLIEFLLTNQSYRYHTLEHEYDGIKSHFDDEVQSKDECNHQLNKV